MVYSIVFVCLTWFAQKTGFSIKISLWLNKIGFVQYGYFSSVHLNNLKAVGVVGVIGVISVIGMYHKYSRID
jgi:hypothetical protein